MFGLRFAAPEYSHNADTTRQMLTTSTLPDGRADAEEAAEPALRQIIEVLQQVMCTHDAEKLAIAVLEIYEDGECEEQSSK